MEDDFAAIPVSNATLLCIGGISNAETIRAREDGMELDGFGYYLFLADEANPTHPIEIIAKLISDDAAHRILNLLRSSAFAAA